MTALPLDVAATRSWYERAAVDLAGTSRLQVSWALGVASDAQLLGLIAELPREHRQPSLLFAVAAWCGAPAVAYPEWREFVVAHWRTIGVEAARRRTQTNEVGRCIPLLLGMSRITSSGGGPIALLEIGASAGLCLALDRYSYRFDDGLVLAPAVGAGSPLLTSRTARTHELKDSSSVRERRATPSRMPHIVWRAGIDLEPLDVRDVDDVRWLESLLPPARPERIARLRAAIATVAADPPRVVAGDAVEALARVAADAPAGTTLVVASLGTMVYLPPTDRAALLDAVAGLGARLVTFEAAAAVPGVPERLSQFAAATSGALELTPFVLAVDGEPIARASAHGDQISWLVPR